MARQEQKVAFMEWTWWKGGRRDRQPEIGEKKLAENDCCRFSKMQVSITNLLIKKRK